MDFTESANQMYDSKWRTQVPNRAERLINRMKALERNMLSAILSLAAPAILGPAFRL